MSTEPLLHDLYTLFFSYTQSPLYRNALSSFRSKRVSSSSSSSSTVQFTESRLHSEYGLYSLSHNRMTALTRSNLVTLSFVLFVLLLLLMPALCLSLLALGLGSSLVVYLSVLSTLYVAVSTVVYSLALISSLTQTSAPFPLSLSSLLYLYFLNIGYFALLYFCMLQAYFAASSTPFPVFRAFRGMEPRDGILNLVHCFYYSITIFTTAGFGDIYATWWLSRLFVSLELCMSSLLHVLVFGQGISHLVTRKQQQQQQQQQQQAPRAVTMGGDNGGPDGAAMFGLRSDKSE